MGAEGARPLNHGEKNRRKSVDQHGDHEMGTQREGGLCNHLSRYTVQPKVKIVDVIEIQAARRALMYNTAMRRDVRHSITAQFRIPRASIRQTHEQI